MKPRLALEPAPANMSRKPFDKQAAHEHLRDGEDTLAECLKTLKRVTKHYPELESVLNLAAGHIDGAKVKIDEAKHQLRSLA